MVLQLHLELEMWEAVSVDSRPLHKLQLEILESWSVELSHGASVIYLESAFVEMETVDWIASQMLLQLLNKKGKTNKILVTYY